VGAPDIKGVHMSKYAIEKDKTLVRHVVFIGDPLKNLYRNRDIVILLFDNKKQAEEISSIWNGSKVVLYEDFISEEEYKTAA
jgi:hypothetical protein